MNFANLEAKIRAEAIEDAPRRAAALEAWHGRRLNFDASPALPALSAACLQDEEDDAFRELDYLERLCAAAASGSRAVPVHRDFVDKVADIRRLADMQPASAACGDGKETHADSSASTSGAAKVGLAGDCAFPTPPASSFHESADRFGHVPQSSGSVSAVASFLMPDVASAAAREDEVRLMAAEGRFGEELAQFPVVAVPGTQQALVLRSWRSWSSEDNIAEQERERVAILELSQAAANLREMMDYIGAAVEQDQPTFNEIEANVGAARERVSEGVVTLKAATEAENRMITFVAPSVCLAILGVGTLAVGGAAAAGCVTCVAVRGAITVGAVSATGVAGTRLKDWQQRALESMTEQLPQAFRPLPEQDVLVLRAAADEAERRLIAKLGDSDAWHRHWVSPTAAFIGLPAFYRPSDVRKGGNAWSTCFEASCTAAHAFQVLQRLNVAGDLDTGCEVAWSRPVDGTAGTFVRYQIYSKWMITRDFYCVCRCARLESASRESYVLAIASLEPQLLASTGLPQNVQDMHHGTIHCSGVRITDLGNRRSMVEVMADVDASLNKWFITQRATDRDLRLHVLLAASRLRNELSSSL